MKTKLSLSTPFTSLLLFGFACGLNAQIVNIPDQNFKNALLNHNPVIDVNNDGEIQVSEAQATIEIDVSGKSIQDLTGIAAFVNIIKLDCENNQLTTLDLSQNISLLELICYNNSLGSLDITQCGSLVFLEAAYNQLTSLNVSQNINLKKLGVIGNFLTSLDVSQNINLQILDCKSNQLTVLDVSQNMDLTIIRCGDNQINILDVSNNTDLTQLNCDNNNIASLDLSQHGMLKFFTAHNNQLTFLDVRNGNNTDIVLFEVQDNPNLKCIFVDDANYSENNPDWIRDPASTYVETQAQCDALGKTDLAFQQIVVYPNPISNRFYISNPSNLQPEKVVVYDVLGNKVKTFRAGASVYDISGLQKGLYFVKIKNNEKSLIRKILKE